MSVRSRLERAGLGVIAAALWLASLISTRALAADTGVPIAAQQIALYSDRSLLVADGGVSVRLPDSGSITATHAVYDLATNMLTLAGNVTVIANSVTTSGPAYRYDFRTHSGTMLTSDDGLVPQLSTNDATAVGQQIVLQPAASILFTNAQVKTGASLSPEASYTYIIRPPQSRDFGLSPVPAAAVDYAIPLPYKGGNTFAFSRLRYDKYNGGAGLGLEEHFAESRRGYLVLAQTMDKDGSRFDLSAYQRMNDSLTQSLIAYHTIGYSYARYFIADTGKRGYSTLSTQQSNGWRSDDLYASSIQRSIGGIGSLRFDGDLGHDLHPPDYPINSDFRGTLGGHYTTPTAHVKGTSLSSSVDIDQTGYNYERNITSSDYNLYVTRSLTKALYFNGSMSFAQTDDRFPTTVPPLNSEYICNVPNPNPLYCFVPPPGASTQRTYIGGLNFTPNNRLSVYAALQYAHDYPQYAGYGRPQYAFAFNVRFIRKNNTGLVIGGILPFGSVGNFYNATVFNVSFIHA